MSKKRITHKKKNIKLPTLTAATADKHSLYQRAVQDSDAMIDLIETVYDTHHKEPPLVLKEDFCGTASLCAQWVKGHPLRTAVGVDLDRPTLDWGLKNNIEPLNENASRVELVQGDVRDVTKQDFDVIAALNFSYFTFHKRSELMEYFRAAKDSLCDGGFLILDLHGGPDSQFALEEPHDFENFEYVWEQGVFDPINNGTVCRIHFRFPDSTEIKDAFVYDWRLWSMPELNDAMKEAGFFAVETWWDGEDDTIRPATTATNTEAWVAYLVAWK